MGFSTSLRQREALYADMHSTTAPKLPCCPCRPHKFKVVYSVALHGETLRTDLRVLNTDDKPLDFTAALHSYIEVLDVEKAGVRGLQGLDYLDKVGALAPSRISRQRCGGAGWGGGGICGSEGAAGRGLPGQGGCPWFIAKVE